MNLSAKLLTAALCAALSTSLMARQVIDDNGDTVDVPDQINRVVVTNILPLASAVTIFTNDGSKVVGMHPASYSAAKTGLLGKLYPEVLNADHSFMQGAHLNVEALMALKPDVVLVNAPDKKTLDIVRNAGLTAFGISPSKWHYDIIRTHNEWMKSLTELWPDQEGKGQLIDEKSRAITEMIKERTAGLADKDRTRALFIYRYDDHQLVTSGKNFFGQYWCEASGAKNVAESVEADNANAVISMEQVYAWNPDVIFITNFTQAMPTDLYNNAIGQHDWSDIQAVKNHRVHKMPLGLYRSYTPSADTPLTLLWMAKQMYPNTFADIDLNKEVKTYYQEIFGVNLTDSDVEQMFHPTVAGSTDATVATRAK